MPISEIKDVAAIIFLKDIFMYPLCQLMIPFEVATTGNQECMDLIVLEIGCIRSIVKSTENLNSPTSMIRYSTMLSGSSKEGHLTQENGRGKRLTPERHFLT